MNINPYRFQRGGELSHKTRTSIPAEAKLRPLRDVLIVEPFEHTLSAIIAVIHEDKPVRGLVKAAGPGCYPKRYNGPKGQRTKMWDSKALRPCDVKPGDIVQFGSFAFDSFYWGDRLHLMMREEDITLVETPDAAPFN